ncbi:MAG: RNA-dependent RNA polymerase [Zhangjiakou Rhabd tick virus 1]|uniref:Replicase n=1 Tax=Zhangjiakou Rhabd tick virus 1 TaxID=2972333 RepID=A0A9E7V2D6_9RHAB|nr:MAG: RNA-dependent RNA polymerase [Zhangjiakou Rhabd tick virus 1]
MSELTDEDWDAAAAVGEDGFESSDEMFEEYFDPEGYLESSSLQAAMRESTELIANDYNLNSPLITDEVEGLLLSLKTGCSLPTRFKSRFFIRVALQNLKEAGIDWSKVTSTSTYHQWIGRLLTDKTEYPKTLLGILKSSSVNWDAALDVLTTFFSSWGKIGLPNKVVLKKLDLLKDPSLIGVSDRVYKDLELFWLFHCLTLMMNSSSQKERKNLQTQEGTGYSWSIEEKDKMTFLARGILPGLGPVIVTSGFVLFSCVGILLDRNMLLMAKDLFAARACTKLSLLGRMETNKYQRQLIKLDNFYLKGDRLLAKHGNQFYPVVKLLEPHANARIIALAQAQKPRVRIPPDFEEFLKESRKEIREKLKIDCTEFFQTISEEPDLDVVLLMYGAFRHWGHPFIDYRAGLAKLKARVTEEKDIDQSYANRLASDLAFYILKSQFSKQRRWFVDPEGLSNTHPLKKHVLSLTWPTPAEIESMGDTWHELPLTPCFEVPEFIDPSTLYADKSHSITRSEFLQHLRTRPGTPVRSKRVLSTALNTPLLEVRKFLEEIDQTGLPEEDLIIGLKAKEREIKSEGRFFALMSWRLREYFVVTEQLIKYKLLPLFKGLTMADSQLTVIQKLLASSAGQGKTLHKKLNYTNHLDYSAWNNHQRMAGTDAVFRVMGRFFGLENIFSRTHEFFEKSWIYYPDRADTISIGEDGVPVCSEGLFFWNGQAGGLEGLRQKGWTLLNLLIILRESKVRNTRVTVLAQGDNQVINTHYVLPDHLPPEELEVALRQVYKNNSEIMTAVVKGTKKLGLKLNKEETMTSSEYLNYGKTPVIRGKIYPLESKRWSRITCVTNDQLPTFANVLSAVSTNALTVAQSSPTITDAAINYTFFSLMSCAVISVHNPLLQGSLLNLVRSLTDQQLNLFYVQVVFLDPSIGGISGTSPTRFLIRQFPDPVVESLTFWKNQAEHNPNQDVSRLARAVGNPRIRQGRRRDFLKLLEKPTSLNLPRGLSATSLIQDQVRLHLIREAPSIVNPLFREAAMNIDEEEQGLLIFLEGIQPLFPKFVADFKAASFAGITESLLGLFENSRTIRVHFSRRFSRTVDALLRQSEVMAVAVLTKELKRDYPVWSCSASQADLLRRLSWKRPVVGTTVPHPFEALGHMTSFGDRCHQCTSSKELVSDKVLVFVSQPICPSLSESGPLCPYLGSTTSETTTLFHPWEKEVKVPLIHRATKLRNTIGWFVDPGTALSESIFNNLESLTEQDWPRESLLTERTGTAVHRYSSPRQSSGGFSSTSPSGLSYVNVTADGMTYCKTRNWDFMYQSFLLYTQGVVVEKFFQKPDPPSQVHFHPQCLSCFREVEDIKLKASMEYMPKRKSPTLVLMVKASGASAVRERKPPPVTTGKWGSVSANEKSFHIGAAQGLAFGLSCIEGQGTEQKIFPLTLVNRVSEIPYLMGLLKGLTSAGVCQAAFHSNLVWRKRPLPIVINTTHALFRKLSTVEAFLSFLKSGSLISAVASTKHRIPASYPPSSLDVGSEIREFLEQGLVTRRFLEEPYSTWGNNLWIFADFQGPRSLTVAICAHRLYRYLFGTAEPLHWKTELSTLKQAISYYSLEVPESETEKARFHDFWANHPEFLNQVFLCLADVRFAASSIPELPPTGSFVRKPWETEVTCASASIVINFSSQDDPTPQDIFLPELKVPLISGLRWVQAATGAHYKIRAVLSRYPWRGDFLCGGDGSGGMTAAILRAYPSARGLFNSLLDLEGSNLRGVAPGLPPAIAAMPPEVFSRCVNIKSCALAPTNLAHHETWKYLEGEINKARLDIGLLVFDMNIRSDLERDAILRNVWKFGTRFLRRDGVCVYKTHATTLARTNFGSVRLFGHIFEKVHCVTTQITGSHSAELYLVGERVRTEASFDVYPTLTSQREVLSMARCRQPIAVEFARSLTLKTKNLLQGVPEDSYPDAEHQLGSILKDLGVPPGEALLIPSQIGGRIRDSTIHPFVGVLVLLAVTSNYIVPTTRGFLNPQPIASDAALQRMISLHVGAWLYLSWATESLLLYHRMVSVLSNKIQYSSTSCAEGFLGHERWFTTWRWNHSLNQKKTFYGVDQLGLASRLIRALSMWNPAGTRYSVPDFESLFEEASREARNWDRGLTTRHLRSSLDLFMGLDIFSDAPDHPSSEEHQYVQGPETLEWQAQPDDVAGLPMDPTGLDEEGGWRGDEHYGV